MTRKKETDTAVSEEDNALVQDLLGQFHQIAANLHSSSSQGEAETVLSDINGMPGASQLALLKALSKEHDADAADVLIALNEFSPHKSIRKEARRSLIRLEGAKVYPRWNPPVSLTPAFQFPVSNPARFWKGFVTQSREEGEMQLILCWEQGFEYSEVRMLVFILDFWERGVKEFILDNSNKRNVDTQIQHLRTHLPGVTLVDCSLAEARRLLDEALSVNKWRGTAPHKEYRHHLPTVNQLLSGEGGEDRGLTFISPNLEPDEVVATFVTAWALGDYGLTYDLLSRNSSVQGGLEREDWIEQRRAWTNEAHPTLFELSFVREREASQSALWVPATFSGRNLSSRKEIEVGWSLELSDTQLSGTLKEMPLGTTVYKETGRHWFWTSYTLIQEEGAWRIQHMTDEGAHAQSLSIEELQKRIKEHDDRVNEILKGSNQPGTRETTEEIIWRVVQTMYYEDALMVHLPFDRNINGDAYHRAIGLGALERAIAYLERIARTFAEYRGEVLRQLGVTQESLSEYYNERGMNERAERFADLAQASIRESLEVENNISGHAVLAELIFRRGGDLDEAEAHLKQAREMVTDKHEEATIEADFGNIAFERQQLQEALQHYQRAADIDPNVQNIWYRIGLVQRRLNQLDDAVASLERAIEMQPQELAPYPELTIIYTQQGQLTRAREILEQGLRSHPKSPHLLALLSSVYLEGGDLRRATAVLEEAEQINPKLDIVHAMRDELNRHKKK